MHFLSARFVSAFDLRFEPAATCLYLRYSVSCTKFKVWKIVTKEDNFIKVKNYIALLYEMRINTQIKKARTKRQKLDGPADVRIFQKSL